MLKKFRFLVITPLLLLMACSQLPIARKPQQPDLKQKLREYSEPAVVRVVAGCFANYYNYSASGERPDKPNEFVGSDYPKSDEFSGQTDGYLIAGVGYLIGTGYFINPEGYIVTSAMLGQFDQQYPDKASCRTHLIEKILKYRRIPVKNEKGETEDRELTSEEKDSFKKEIQQGSVARIGDKAIQLEDEAIQYSKRVIFSGGESLPFRHRSVSGTGMKGENVALIKISVTNAPALKLADSDPVGIQGDVWVFGYPPDAELFDPDQDTQKTRIEFIRNFLNQRRELDSNISDRSISGTPTQDNFTTLQIDGQLLYGMWGSPVLSANGEVIGMITRTGRNYTLAVPARAIKGFIDVPNNQGETYQKYRDALDSFWRGEYAQADALFRQVQSLVPQHSKIAKQIQKNQAEWALHPDNQLLPWILLAGVGLLGIPTIAFLLLRRPSQLQPVAYPPQPDHPDHANNNNRPKPRPGNPDPTKANFTPFIELSYQGQDLQFYLGEEAYHLGRDPNWSDFEIPNSWNLISRHHAILRKEGSDYRLYDGDGDAPSANGNFVHGNRVTTREGYLLRHATQVRIGPDRNPILLTYFNPTHRQAPDPTKVAEE